MPSVSLILPATDETHSLVETVVRAASLLQDRRVEYLIVTSPKLTTSECRATIVELQKKYGASIVTFDQTRPYIGGAITDAFVRAQGEYTVLMASDLETDPTVLPDLLKALDAGADVAATTRWKRGARFSGYHPVKFVFNYLFQQFFRVLYLTSLTDLTYAYRAYRTEIVHKIRWEEERFPILFETLIKPLRLGYRIVEIEAPWKARSEGVSHNSLDQTLAYIRTGVRVRFMRKSRMVYSSPSL